MTALLFVCSVWYPLRNVVVDVLKERENMLESKCQMISTDDIYWLIPWN
jgi:hypothetical protein